MPGAGAGDPRLRFHFAHALFQYHQGFLLRVVSLAQFEQLLLQGRYICLCSCMQEGGWKKGSDTYCNLKRI